VYTLNHSTFELFLTAGFGAIGCALRRWHLDPTPLLLGFVLSQPLEENVRRALLFSNGALTTFAAHPVSALLLGATLVIVVVRAVSHAKRAA
jgi:TctA family transporter